VEPQQLGRGERLVKAEVFGKEANARTGCAIAERSAQHATRAGRRLDERQQHLDCGGLAGAVRPEEPEDLPLADVSQGSGDGDREPGGGGELLRRHARREPNEAAVGDQEG
jgi:hypothetical protein